MQKKLEWLSKYSVGVQIIDEQHRKMFEVINHLISVLGQMPTKTQVDEIINSLIDYKQLHFATEEKFFQLYHYEFAAEHIAKHQEFGAKLNALVKKHHGDSISLAFALVDFLEDWLLDHLMTEDQKYVACFKAHGLS